MSGRDIHILYRACSGRQIPGKKDGNKNVSEFSNNKALFNISSPSIIIKEKWVYLLGNVTRDVEYVEIRT
jgi:hypothetical protein